MNEHPRGSPPPFYPEERFHEIVIAVDEGHIHLGAVRFAPGTVGEHRGTRQSAGQVRRRAE